MNPLIPHQKVAMVQCTPAILPDFFVPLVDEYSHSAALRIMLYRWCCNPVVSIFVWKWSIHYASLSAMFNLLHSSMNQELFWKHFYNQSSHCEKHRQFPSCKGSHVYMPPNQHFTKMNGTQRRTLVTPWRVHVTYCGMIKCISWAEMILNNKPVVLQLSS